MSIFAESIEVTDVGVAQLLYSNPAKVGYIT